MTPLQGERRRMRVFPAQKDSAYSLIRHPSFFLPSGFLPVLTDGIRHVPADECRLPARA